MGVCLSCNYWQATVGSQCEACAGEACAGEDRRSQSLPENATFPWDDMVDMTGPENRGDGIALNAIHEQLCVVADLLRIVICGQRVTP